MKNVKGLCLLCLGMLFGLMLTGCGKDEALDEYQENMETFFEHIIEFDNNMNAIDVSQADYVTQMLDYLDALDAEVAWMAQLEVPEQFSAVESLADEASENMTQAVSFYHMVYDSGEYDANIEQAAKEYYNRANIRIKYIVMLLHGEIPEGEGVTYTEEDRIFGGGYLNKNDDDDEDGESAGGADSGNDTPTPISAGSAPVSAEPDEPVTDDFDTDDTVFYEE